MIRNLTAQRGVLEINVDSAVQRCLEDYGMVTEGRVDPQEIARAAGIKVIKNSAINDLKPGEYGAAYYIKGKWYIIYDDNLSLEEKRFTIAHELGHIFMEINNECKGFMMYIKELEREHWLITEYQADLFARSLLGIPAGEVKA